GTPLGRVTRKLNHFFVTQSSVCPQYGPVVSIFTHYQLQKDTGIGEFQDFPYGAFHARFRAGLIVGPVVPPLFNQISCLEARGFRLHWLQQRRLSLRGVLSRFYERLTLDTFWPGLQALKNDRSQSLPSL